MISATAAEPTNDTACTSRGASSASTVSRPPCTRLSTPDGKPASPSSSASRMDVSGVRSEGFSTNVLPATMASGNIHIGIMPGKLYGVMPTHTPSGCRSEEHTSELQSRENLVCRLLLEKKNESNTH